MASAVAQQASNTYNVWNKQIKPAFIGIYNLTVEYQLNNTASVQVGYVGEVRTASGHRKSAQPTAQSMHHQWRCPDRGYGYPECQPASPWLLLRSTPLLA